jgi:tyrocidine synthetase-3
MITGILAVLKSGGGYLPITPGQPRERITYMLNDSRASVLLTSTRLAGTVTGSHYCRLVYLDDSSFDSGSGTNLEKISKPADTVYTIYTSGTTGKSKGALIENKNLVNYTHWIQTEIRVSDRDRTVLTSSFGFDLGYTIIYSSLLSGCQLHIIPREVYLSPGDLLDYMVRSRVTYIKVTPSLFTTIVESSRFSREICRQLRMVLLGGEEIKLKDVEKAHAIGPHMAIMNHYGPTEATIGCIARFIDFSAIDHYREKPTIGFPIHNMKAVILDKQLKLVPFGTVGELCVSGAGVVRGYLNRPELVAEKFTRHPYIPGQKMYRTGDMARWILSGAIQFLGRIDSQVKIRGYRVETGEIESQLLHHQAIKEAVVIHRQRANGDKYLCAYIVWNQDEAVDTPVPWPELNRYVSDKLPDYMIPSYFVTLDQLPLTPNGKLNRKLLPEPGIQIETGCAAPRSVLEDKMVEIWTDVLFGKDSGVLYGTPNPGSPSIGIDDNFFRLGGHSLKAIILISRMHKVFHVDVPLAEIFKAPTIRGLSAYIKNKEQGLYASIEPVEEKDYYTVSSTQKRLYFLHQMDEDGTGYNMPYVSVLEGEVDKDKLESAFLTLIARHKSLRTSFHLQDGAPVQRIRKTVEFEIQYHEISGEEKITSYASIIKGFIRPFDLVHAPLLRVGLAKKTEKRHLFIVDMHHIISDGISRRILVQEFMALMADQTLSPLRLQYNDFSAWQNSKEQKQALIKQKVYWKKQLAGEIPVLDLPTDYTRPAIQRFEGSQVTTEIDREQADALQALELTEGTTLYMILLTIYYIFLSKLGNQEDILVGTPILGRRHAELEQIIGMFVNTLVLRNYPNGEKTYRGFLKEIKTRSLEVFENQDYPYEELVEEVSAARDTSRNPLFDTMFVMQNLGIPKIEVPGLQLAPYEHQIETSKFDLTLMAMEVEKELLLNFEYSTNLFKKITTERYLTYLKKIVSIVAANPDVKICDVEILAEDEKKKI